MTGRGPVAVSRDDPWRPHRRGSHASFAPTGSKPRPRIPIRRGRSSAPARHLLIGQRGPYVEDAVDPGSALPDELVWPGARRRRGPLVALSVRRGASPRHRRGSRGGACPPGHPMASGGMAAPEDDAVPLGDVPAAAPHGRRHEMRRGLQWLSTPWPAARCVRCRRLARFLK